MNLFSLDFLHFLPNANAGCKRERCVRGRRLRVAAGPSRMRNRQRPVRQPSRLPPFVARPDPGCCGVRLGTGTAACCRLCSWKAAACATLKGRWGAMPGRLSSGPCCRRGTGRGQMRPQSTTPEQTAPHCGPSIPSQWPPLLQETRAGLDFGCLSNRDSAGRRRLLLLLPDPAPRRAGGN